MGFTSAYGAGDGADMLTQILQQKIAQANADRQFALAQQKAQQDAQESASRIALQREGLASSIDQRGQQADSARTTQALAVGNATPVGTILDPDALKVLQAGHQGSNITADQTLGSRNLSGAAGGPITSTDNPGTLTGQMRWAGTAGQQDKAQKDAQMARFLANPNLSDEARLALQYEGMTGKNAPGALVKPPAAAKPETNPFYARDPRTGALRYVQDLPANAKVGTDAPPPQDHFSFQSGTGPDGKAALYRVNTQTGASTIVTPGDGGTLGKGPGATVQNRIESAKAVTQTGNDIIQMLSDPTIAAQLGPAMSRFNSIADFVGNPPPEFSKLAGMIESYSLANMGVHGMRSNTGAEAIKQTLGLTRHTPQSMIAAIQGLNGFAGHLMQNNGQSAATPGGASGDPAAAAAALIKKYGGG